MTDDRTPKQDLPKRDLSGALDSDPKENVKDAEQTFDRPEDDEAVEANRELREKKKQQHDRPAIVKDIIMPGSGSPD